MTTINTQPESIRHLVTEGFRLPVLTANFIILSLSQPTVMESKSQKIGMTMTIIKKEKYSAI
ncbi:hypothetical protein [Aggregatibacter actinomycetemcomitans]|uniref:hypothetical protein n=1 Tax=Aggregatibacter actinomycetemcomitans TaxID=714 RepID=UPI00197B4E9E|nr:hypothetical protein [Aggregatibacter actinomycetemcomitans]MBN6064393.1 hypothetical protein [Aggregatibacter actinomycetemcomitans]MBN6084330.1 hypothetical protein [Aggregatibacter actinomycetemcomitans]